MSVSKMITAEGRAKRTYDLSVLVGETGMLFSKAPRTRLPIAGSGFFHLPTQAAETNVALPQVGLRTAPTFGEAKR